MSLSNNPITHLMDKATDFFKWLEPSVNDIITLGLRIWLALIFWKSALTKTGKWDGEELGFTGWESTLFLFEYEYAVPFLPVGFAAFSATLIEIIAPLFIITGLATRFAAIPLLFMTAVIQFTYLNSMSHLYWAAACLFLMVNGAGRYSWDHLIATKRSGSVNEGTFFGRSLATFIVFGLTLAVAYEFAASLFDIGLTPIIEAITEAFKEKK